MSMQTVPCVSSDDYENTPFLEYPSSIGISLDSEWQAGFSGVLDRDSMDCKERFVICLRRVSKDMLERFLQTWLFFSLLKEILGGLFKHDDFVTHSGTHDKGVLSRDVLGDRINSWVSEQLATQTLQDISYLRHLVICMRISELVIFAICENEFNVNPHLLLFLASNAEMIENSLNKLLDEKKLDQVPRCRGGYTLKSLERSQIQAMQGNGWCPNRARQMLKLMTSAFSQQYLASISKEESAFRHRSCTIDRCDPSVAGIANNIPKHRNPTCKCKSVQFDESKIVDITTSGSVAVFDVQLPSVKEMSLSIVPTSSKVNYVALSHVWADGLGNPERNALPECQLLHLSTVIKEFQRSIENGEDESELLLWLDTICFPADDTAKEKALTTMMKTYRDAAHVLVLDAELVTIKSRGVSKLELAMRLLASNWAFRLWTLQEAVLACNLWIQFADAVINFDTLQQAAWNDAKLWNPATYLISHSLLVEFAYMRNKLYFENKGNMYGAITSLSRRSVSVQSDEALCLATLLGVDASKLGKVSVQRMARLWKEIAVRGYQIPRNIIFAAHTKVESIGLRWAPTSLLQSSHKRDIREYFTKQEGYGQILPHGLLIKSSVAQIAIPRPIVELSETQWVSFSEVFSHSLYVKDTANNWYEMVDNQEEGKVSIARTIRWTEPDHYAMAEDGHGPLGALFQEIAIHDGVKTLHRKCGVTWTRLANPKLVRDAERAVDRLRSRLGQKVIGIAAQTNGDAETTWGDAKPADFWQAINSSLNDLRSEDETFAAMSNKLKEEDRLEFCGLVLMLYIGYYAVRGDWSSEESLYID